MLEENQKTLIGMSELVSCSHKYLEKWRKNMARIDEDWSLKGVGK